MSRELKFRIWDKKEGCWTNDPILIYPNIEFIGQGLIVQQYIGLADKNGKEIYEGDFITFSCDYTIDSSAVDVVQWGNQEVFYDEEYAGFYFGRKLQFQIPDKIMPETIEVVGRQFQILDEIMPETIEVVGNIFENPDLSIKEG